MLRSVVVCDQVQLFREGVARVLDPSRFHVNHCVRSLDEIVYDQTMKRGVDLIILGVNDDFVFEPRTLGFGATAENDPPIVVLATSPTRTLIRSAMSAGIRAVLSKDISGDILSSALELVLFGHRFFPAYDDPSDTEVQSKSAITAGTISPANDRMQIRLTAPSGDDDIQLSEREEQILCRLISGAPNKSIARDLAITDSTVKVHIKGLLRKLRVTNRTQAAIWGVHYGYSGDRRINKRSNGGLVLMNDVRAAS